MAAVKGGFHGLPQRRIQRHLLGRRRRDGHHGREDQGAVDQLISKGELTVDQGRQINTELKHKAEQAVATVRYDALEARMAAMTPEERAEFAAKAAEIAARVDAQEKAGAEVGDASAVETSDDPAASGAAQAPAEPVQPCS